MCVLDEEGGKNKGMHGGRVHHTKIWSRNGRLLHQEANGGFKTGS